jgi:hypothetical protein
MRFVLLNDAVIELVRFKLSQELKFYITQNGSFNGPLNYYRTTKIRFDEEKGKWTPRR